MKWRASFLHSRYSQIIDRPENVSVKADNGVLGGAIMVNHLHTSYARRFIDVSGTLVIVDIRLTLDSAKTLDESDKEEPNRGDETLKRGNIGMENSGSISDKYSQRQLDYIGCVRSQLDGMVISVEYENENGNFVGQSVTALYHPPVNGIAWQHSKRLVRNVQNRKIRAVQYANCSWWQPRGLFRTTGIVPGLAKSREGHPLMMRSPISFAIWSHRSMHSLLEMQASRLMTHECGKLKFLWWCGSSRSGNYVIHEMPTVYLHKGKCWSDVGYKMSRSRWNSGDLVLEANGVNLRALSKASEFQFIFQYIYVPHCNTWGAF